MGAKPAAMTFVPGQDFGTVSIITDGGDLMPEVLTLGKVVSIERQGVVDPVMTDDGTIRYEANLTRIGGPILGGHATKGEAVQAEINWLLEHKIQR